MCTASLCGRFSPSLAINYCCPGGDAWLSIGETFGPWPGTQFKLEHLGRCRALIARSKRLARARCWMPTRRTLNKRRLSSSALYFLCVHIVERPDFPMVGFSQIEDFQRPWW